MQMDALSDRLKNLSPAKRKALKALLRGRGVEQNRTIPRRSDQRSFPLSFAQERLWFLHQIDPTLAAYNMCGGIRMRFPIEHVWVQAAVQALVRRHSLLRAKFI